VASRRDDQSPGVTRRDAGDGITRRDDDVEGHSMHRSDDGVTRRDGEGVTRRDGGGDGVTRRDDKTSFIGSDEDDVEGHSMFRDAGESLHRGLPGSGGEFTRRGPGDNPHGDR
jgi:hypothetical protein